MTRRWQIGFALLAITSVAIVCLSVSRNEWSTSSSTNSFTLLIHLLTLLPPFASVLAFLRPRFLFVVLFCSGVEAVIGLIGILPIWISQLLRNESFGREDHAIIALEIMVLPMIYFVASALAIRTITLERTKVFVRGAFVLAAIVGLTVALRLKEAREVSRLGPCVGSLKMIWLASDAYEKKHAVSAFDVTTNAEQLVSLLVLEGFIQPDHVGCMKCNCRYEYVFADPIEDRSRMHSHARPVLRDAEKNAHSSKGINVLFSDGHVEGRK